MEIPARSFIPKTTRNRWAWGFAWASLAVFLLWNLMPDYLGGYAPGAEPEDVVRKSLVMIYVWPNIISTLYYACSSTPDFESMLGMISSLALIFCGILQFLLAPLWRFISSSRLLRFIPAGICFLGTLVMLLYIGRRLSTFHVSEYFHLVILSLLTLNLLLSTIALLLYHQENPHPHES
jgi:hypothetical protein